MFCKVLCSDLEMFVRTIEYYIKQKRMKINSQETLIILYTNTSVFMYTDQVTAMTQTPGNVSRRIVNHAFERLIAKLIVTHIKNCCLLFQIHIFHHDLRSCFCRRVRSMYITVVECWQSDLLQKKQGRRKTNL